MTSYVSAVPILNSSTGTGFTGCPSALTTVIFKLGILTSKNDIAEALMNRRRTFSPVLKLPIQFCSGVLPFIKKVYFVTSDISVLSIRIWFHIERSCHVAFRPFLLTCFSTSNTVSRRF